MMKTNLNESKNNVDNSNNNYFIGTTIKYNCITHYQ